MGANSHEFMAARNQVGDKLPKLTWKILMNQEQPQESKSALHSHYPLWPALCGELELARETILKLNIDNTQKAHWLLNIGDYKNAEILNQTGSNRGSVLFRLLRRKGGHNPYQELLKLSPGEKQTVITTAMEEGVILSGGIGDHIEQISQVKPACEEYGKNIKMVTTRERYLQLKSAVSNIYEAENFKGKMPVQIEVLLAALGDELPLPKAIFRDNHKKTNKSNRRLLCCWNVHGKGDIMSKWSRSVQFTQATKLYSLLKANGYELSDIVDMSKWQSWEEELLRKEGIKIFDPTKGDVMDTIKKIGEVEYVVSVDTAMVHICASLKQACIALLPIYPDERWYKFRKKGTIYSEKCNFIQQKEYGCWEREIEIAVKLINRP